MCFIFLTLSVAWTLIFFNLSVLSDMELKCRNFLYPQIPCSNEANIVFIYLYFHYDKKVIIYQFLFQMLVLSYMLHPNNFKPLFELFWRRWILCIILLFLLTNLMCPPNSLWFEYQIRSSVLYSLQWKNCATCYSCNSRVIF